MPALLGLSTAWLSSTRSKKPVCGCSSIQGRRPNQEDRYCICDQLPGSSCGFYAVYDGHGGHRAASFAAEKMQGFLTRSSAYKGKDLVKALQQAFHDCETEFIAIAGREGLRDGTTAVVALVQDESLTVAHVGDSRGVLCRADGAAQAITQDHKPEIEKEKKRIEELGGFVSHIGCWRAMGILAMSRAIGDLFLKPYVSAEPDVSAMALEATDEFVILASDGVFDVFDNDQVVRIARSAGSPQEAANLLTSSAFHAGSLDNVTAVVVALKGYKPKAGTLAAAASVAEPLASVTAARGGACDGCGVAPCASPPSSLTARHMIAAAWGDGHTLRGPDAEAGAASAASAGHAARAAAAAAAGAGGQPATWSSRNVGHASCRRASGDMLGRRARQESFRHAIWLDLVAH